MPTSARPSAAPPTRGCRARSLRAPRPPSDHPHELPGVVAGRSGVVAHRHRDAGVARGRERLVRLIQLALRLLDQRRGELLAEALGEVVERAQRRDEHMAALAISTRSSGSRCSESPCSIVSTPSSIASRVPSRPSACAATRMPSRCASSTMAATSSRVSCAGSGSSTLDGARAGRHELHVVRAAPQVLAHRLRIGPGPSASVYIVVKMRPPGEVAEMIRPHDRIRGPGGEAELDGLPHHDRLVVHRADVADGGDPGLEWARRDLASNR